jgi:ATP/maltotriose-dependent transcriptional regulator MalT
MDYLIEEVLKIQTEEIREFLLQTSHFGTAVCSALQRPTGPQGSVNRAGNAGEK